LGPDGLSKNWIVNFIADHIAGAIYYATFFIRPTIGGGIQTETLTQNSMTGDWSDEETDEPLLADHHNYYKVREVDQGRRQGRAHASGSNLDKAPEVFGAAVANRITRPVSAQCVAAAALLLPAVARLGRLTRPLITEEGSPESSQDGGVSRPAAPTHRLSAGCVQDSTPGRPFMRKGRAPLAWIGCQPPTNTS
jgi:hypothetical protein